MVLSGPPLRPRAHPRWAYPALGGALAHPVAAPHRGPPPGRPGTGAPPAPGNPQRTRAARADFRSTVEGSTADVPAGGRLTVLPGQKTAGSWAGGREAGGRNPQRAGQSAGTIER